MNLSSHERQMLQSMPDLSFGMDRENYVKHCMSWARESGHNSMTAMELAKVKWQAWEVERLIVNIEEGSVPALQRAVVMLLRDRYIP